MKTIFISSFLIIISLGICVAQTSTNTTSPVRQSTRVESVTADLTQRLNLSPTQQDQVRTVFEQSLQQIHQVVESNNSDKHLANDQIQVLIQQRETALQTILSPQQYTLYQTPSSK